MLQLITRRWSVTNAPPALSASIAPGVSAPLIGEPTPLTEATPTASQVPTSSTSSVFVQPLRVLSSQRSTCSRTFTFDLAMRPLSSFLLLWWKNTLLFSKKQHRSFPWRPRSRTGPEDVGLKILTKVMDQKFGRHHGKVVRCMGKARVREMGAFSFKSTTGEVNALKEKVTTLKGQLAVEGEQMRAQGEQMSMIVQALQMSDL